MRGRRLFPLGLSRKSRKYGITCKLASNLTMAGKTLASMSYVYHIIVPLIWRLSEKQATIETSSGIECLNSVSRSDWYWFHGEIIIILVTVTENFKDLFHGLE